MTQPTCSWLENRLSESEIVTDAKINALNRRINALEQMIRSILGISQEELNRRLGGAIEDGT